MGTHAAILLERHPSDLKRDGSNLLWSRGGNVEAFDAKPTFDKAALIAARKLFDGEHREVVAAAT